MKNLLAKLLFTLSGVAASMYTWAQDKKLDIDIDVNKKSDWYQQPWVWVAGGAVFILLLVAILRNGKK